MPYELRGNKVVKSSTGEVVKDHGSDHAKAVRHLRALKANVEEAAPLVLGALLEGFESGKHPRGAMGRWIATFHHSAHGTTTSPIEAHSSAEAQQKAEALARASSGGRFHQTVQSVAPHDARALQIMQGESGRKFDSIGAAARAGALPSQRDKTGAPTGRKYDSIGAVARAGALPSQQPAFDPVSALGREGKAARERGAISIASEHADTRDKLTSLPMGQSYGLHGPHGQIGRVDRTAKGWEVHAGDAQPKVHKTPSSAAGHAMRLQRQAAATRTDVSTRNYRGAQEVRAMNARQAQIAGAERLRAEMDRHGGFKIGDVVTHETGSREAGGHGPVTFTKQPGMSTVVGLQRNGNLRLKEPVHGTTHDVHHSHAQKVSPLHPDYRGKVAQDAYAAQRAELARQKAERARRSGRALSESEVLGVLLEGEHERVQEAIGSVEKGAFHRWLGKKEDEPITPADIAKGLAAGGHPAQMARFAKASKKWGK